MTEEKNRFVPNQLDCHTDGYASVYKALQRDKGVIDLRSIETITDTALRGLLVGGSVAEQQKNKIIDIEIGENEELKKRWKKQQKELFGQHSEVLDTYETEVLD